MYGSAFGLHLKKTDGESKNEAKKRRAGGWRREEEREGEVKE